MDLSPVKINLPKNATWIGSETLDLHQGHNTAVALLIGDLAQLDHGRHRAPAQRVPAPGAVSDESIFAADDVTPPAMVPRVRRRDPAECRQ